MKARQRCLEGAKMTMRKQTCMWCLMDWMHDNDMDWCPWSAREQFRTVCFAIPEPQAKTGWTYICSFHIRFFDANPTNFLSKRYPNTICAECDSRMARDDYLCRSCRLKVPIAQLDRAIPS
jgi:hypothetical protein